MSHERGDLPPGYSYVDGRTGLMGYEYVDPRTGIGSIRYGPRQRPAAIGVMAPRQRTKVIRRPTRRAAIASPIPARFRYVDSRTGIGGYPGGGGRSGTDYSYEEGSEESDLGFLGIKKARFKINKKSFTRPLKSVAKYAPVAAAGLIPIPGVGQLLSKVPIIGKPIVGKVDSIASAIFRRGAPAPSPLPAGVTLQTQATPGGGSQVVAVDPAGAVVSKPIPPATIIASALPVIDSMLPSNTPQAAAPVSDTAPGSGGSAAVDAASNVLSFADKLKQQADSVAQRIRDAESKVDDVTNAVAGGISRGGQVVDAAANAGVATAATGDASSGQLVGALMANPALLAVAALGTYAMFKVSGPSNRRRR